MNSRASYNAASEAWFWNENFYFDFIQFKTTFWFPKKNLTYSLSFAW